MKNAIGSLPVDFAGISSLAWVSFWYPVTVVVSSPCRGQEKRTLLRKFSLIFYIGSLMTISILVNSLSHCLVLATTSVT